MAVAVWQQGPSRQVDAGVASTGGVSVETSKTTCAAVALKLLSMTATDVAASINARNQQTARHWASSSKCRLIQAAVSQLHETRSSGNSVQG